MSCSTRQRSTQSSASWSVRQPTCTSTWLQPCALRQTLCPLPLLQGMLPSGLIPGSPACPSNQMMLFLARRHRLLEVWQHSMCSFAPQHACQALLLWGHAMHADTSTKSENMTKLSLVCRGGHLGSSGTSGAYTGTHLGSSGASGGYTGTNLGSSGPSGGYGGAGAGAPLASSGLSGAPRTSYQ